MQLNTCNTRTALITICLCFSALALWSQHEEELQQELRHETEMVVHDMKGKHRLTLGLGHTHISTGKVQGKTQRLLAPSWSFNYDYWLTNKWAIGLQTDIIIETFEVEHNHEELVERENPLAVVPVAIYKPFLRLAFFAGVGAEISRAETIAMTRLGAEYAWVLPKYWEVGIEVLWDGKWNYYNSWALAFTASKILGHHRE